MKFIRSAERPTLTRYRTLSENIQRKSLTRALQYEVLLALPNLGRMLDVGGGDRADYLALIKFAHYDSINIDPDINPTWVSDVGDSFPSDFESYDTVLSMNTLEHVFEPAFVLGEMYRALKPGGALVISTPFLYPIHGHPDDFFRPTPSWYQHALERAGFYQVEVTPLAWGARSTRLTCAGSGRFGVGFQKQSALLIDFLEAKVRDLLHKTPDPAYWQRLATAFFVQAKKPERATSVGGTLERSSNKV